MVSNEPLNKPWMIAVWPGMGQVALSAGYFLMAKLGMRAIGEFSPEGLFDVDHVDVRDGLIRPPARPRSRLFVWHDPQERHDVVLFIGEAQPSIGKYAFCQRLIGKAKELGVEHVFTFAAMATDMHPQHEARVFGAATHGEGLRELQRLELHPLSRGQISGLNGVLVGAATEAEIRGTCLLGEIPGVFSQLPYPAASLAVLQVFTTMAGIELDMTELADQARAMEKQLGHVMAQVEHLMRQQQPQQAEAESPQGTTEDEPRLSPADEQRIEKLFQAAAEDRSRAYELKQALDELGVFREFEDRFLDLFR